MGIVEHSFQKRSFKLCHFLYVGLTNQFFNLKQKPTEFVSLYESCFDNIRQIVLFTNYNRHGSKFNVKARLDSIPILPDDEWLYDDQRLNRFYNKVSSSA